LDEPLIELRSVDKSYKLGEMTVHALRGMNLSIAPGEFVMLLGPSGSGKTTTLNLIGGLDSPTSGQVIVEGEDIASYDDRRLTTYRRRKVGFIFQFYNLIPTLNARENVMMALRLVHAGSGLRRRADDLLEQVGMSHRADHFPSQLSGGEQQRVAIARALAKNPTLMLCDEPTGELDVETGEQVLRVIQQLNRENGTTVVMVTHNVSLAPISDRAVHVRDGAVDTIEQHDAPAAVADLVMR
jgi:putative ABC transport system ATP-binding protein